MAMVSFEMGMKKKKKYTYEEVERLISQERKAIYEQEDKDRFRRDINECLSKLTDRINALEERVSLLEIKKSRNKKVLID